MLKSVGNISLNQGGKQTKVNTLVLFYIVSQKVIQITRKTFRQGTLFLNVININTQFIQGQF